MSGYDAAALAQDDTLGTDEVPIKMAYSRSNEDQIIERMLAVTDAPTRICVDIGAKDLENSNVANLVLNHGWRALLIERGIKNFHTLFGKWPPERVCIMYATVLPKNVNDLLPKDFDLLSIDIDGQDYHVWAALEARPRMVVIEYNPRKAGHAVQPQDDAYEWKKSRDFDAYGASRGALLALADRKGYDLFDHNTDNLFFTLR